VDLLGIIVTVTFVLLLLAAIFLPRIERRQDRE
jgi:hypothetical protein